MRQIKNIEEITSKCPSWKPQDIAFIKKIEWSIEDMTIAFYCQPRNGGFGWPNLVKGFFEVSILFRNVSDFRLEFNSAGLQQVSGFDIIDVSNDGLEKINFRIDDYENGVIRFSCEDVIINDFLGVDKVLFD
jgi:hypothetical protein